MNSSSFAPPPRRRIVPPAWTLSASTTPAPQEPPRETRRRNKSRSAPRADLPALPGGDELFITHPDVLLAMLGEDPGFEVPRAAKAPSALDGEPHVAPRTPKPQPAGAPLLEAVAEPEDAVDEDDDESTRAPEEAASPRSPAEVEATCRANLSRADELAREVHERIGDRVSLTLLASAARRGLWEAATRFDPERGIDFRFFAHRRIVGAMLDELRAEHVLASSRRGRLSPHLIAMLGGCSLQQRATDDVNDMEWLGSWAAVRGVHAVPVAGDISLSGVIDADQAPADEQLAHAELMTVLRSAIGELEQRDQTIIYGVYEHEQTLDDTAGALGLSKSWGSRLHAEIIVRLKRAMLRAGFRELFERAALPPVGDKPIRAELG